MSFILLFISIFFSLIPTCLYPKSHRLLRNNFIFISAFIFAVLITFVGWFFNCDFAKPGFKLSYFMLTLNPLIFLMLYKLFNLFILHKLNRNIYFRDRIVTDVETTNATWLEFGLQNILAFLPIILLLIGKQ